MTYQLLGNTFFQIFLFLFGHYFFYYITNFTLWKFGITNYLVFLGWWYLVLYFYNSLILKLDQFTKNLEPQELLSYFTLNFLSILMLGTYSILGIWTSLFFGLFGYLVIRRV